GVVEQGEGEDEAGGLDEHAGDDEGFAADAVGEVAGGDLADAPQDGVEALDEADGGQAEAVVGEEKGEDAPGESVVEVVDEAGLAGAAQGAVAPGGAGEGGGEAGRLVGGRGLGVLGEFEGDVGCGVADDEGQGEAGDDEDDAEEFWNGAEAVAGGEVAGEQCGDADGGVSGGLVESGGESAPGGPDEVDLHVDGHRPRQALVEAEQDV